MSSGNCLALLLNRWRYSALFLVHSLIWKKKGPEAKLTTVIYYIIITIYYAEERLSLSLTHTRTHTHLAFSQPASLMVLLKYSINRLCF